MAKKQTFHIPANFWDGTSKYLLGERGYGKTNQIGERESLTMTVE
jgi:hypothetical protein